MNTQSQIQNQSSTETTRFTEALTSIHDELMALPAESLATINVDIAAATTTAIGCMPELRMHRDAILARFGPETGALLDRLETYARAASQANAKLLIPTSVAPDIQELSKRAVEVRAMLATDAQALVHRKVFGAEKLLGLRGPIGFKNQVTDIQQLVQMFRDDWDAVKQVSPIKPEELDLAEDIANALVVATGEREQSAPAASPAADLRLRAFTLFFRTYDELRRAISYLRWHEGDVEQIIPSLYAGRGGRGKRVEDEPTPVVVAPTPTTDVVRAQPGPAPVSDDPEGKPPARPNPDMPGADPFIS